MRVKIHLLITIFFIFLLAITYKIFYELKKENQIKKDNQIFITENLLIENMLDKIKYCNNDYFLGFYKIDEIAKSISIIDIVKSFKKDAYSIVKYNPYFSSKKNIDDITLSSLKFISNKFVFFPRVKDFPIVEELVKNSTSKLKDVGIILIKNENNNYIYVFSIAVLKYSNCSKKYTIQILEDLANELEGKL